MRHQIQMTAAVLWVLVAGCDSRPASSQSSGVSPTKAAPANRSELDGIWNQINGSKAWQWEFENGELIERKGPPWSETSRKPFRIDLSSDLAKLEWGEGYKGIYRLKEDGLAVCFNSATDETPTTFDTQGGKFSMYIFKRE